MACRNVLRFLAKISRIFIPRNHARCIAFIYRVFYSITWDAAISTVRHVSLAGNLPITSMMVMYPFSDCQAKDVCIPGYPVSHLRYDGIRQCVGERRWRSMYDRLWQVPRIRLRTRANRHKHCTVLLSRHARAAIVIYLRFKQCHGGQPNTDHPVARASRPAA